MFQIRFFSSMTSENIYNIHKVVREIEITTLSSQKRNNGNDFEIDCQYHSKSTKFENCQ